jgi:hypothetical protein
MIVVRRMRPDDIDSVAQILVDAFAVVYRQRGHTPPFPNVESAAWLCRAYLDLDPEASVLAEQGRLPLGVGFAHPRGPVASIGPLAAKPGAPAGIGRSIMTHFHKLTAGCQSIRLFQDSFNAASFGLYTRLGYRVVDVAPYLLAGQLQPPAAPPTDVRTITAADLPRLARYDLMRTGAERRRDLDLLAASGSAFVHETVGAVSGYLFFRALPARVIVGPAVAESDEILCRMLDAVAYALPGRAAVIRASAAAPSVLKRAFQRGFRVDHLGNLMVSGDYTVPPVQFYALFPESL